ncbi:MULTISPECIES: DUF2845 domain-containing protein [Aeromonas]|uniref:DUF2845 domain-containing protein n=1 Tax=Aeromonas TaxID=642 RepID=UPI00044B429B|nr:MULTISPECIES: DUF2845 domain-containing protein [Aeromonas]AXB01449.1 DUF2845 domain-containing protein [Aeromonas caviae]EZH84761.1 hypothetical protein AT59_00755 [Aeromonas hydrophila AD9]MBL0496183.1 DUF2845 domain-containing protein [Aeromonas caviae]
MRRLMILLILAMPVVANAGAMRCKSALISEGDSSFNVQKKCGQPQMKEDIIDERLLDAPKIGERWTYQARESDIPQAVTIINGKVTQIEDLTR